LEAFLERGPRAIITTHFHRLKTVSAMDDRFTIAGMQFANGRPTYRLIPGASGDSHALETASRIGLPPEVVERARALMGEGERELADTLSALDRERERAEAAARRAAELAAELETQKTSLAAKEARLTAKAEALKEERAAAFLQRLNQAEKAISAVVADLQNNPSHRGVQTARAAANAVRGLVKAPKPPINPTPKPVAAESLKVGDRVRLTKLGKIGEITSLSGRQAKVRAGGLQLAVKLTELERLDEHGRSEPVVKTLPPRTKKDSGETKRPHVHDAVRHPANTVDLRGMRVDEGIEAVEKFFDQATMRNHQIVFILHGHGTGRMKTAIRRWLPSCGYVEDWAPAMPDQGGDAYTVAAMR
jgi:DNA mismatch repair protein MutS2